MGLRGLESEITTETEGRRSFLEDVEFPAVKFNLAMCRFYLENPESIPLSIFEALGVGEITSDHRRAVLELIQIQIEELEILFRETGEVTPDTAQYHI